LLFKKKGEKSEKLQTALNHCKEEEERGRKIIIVMTKAPSPGSLGKKRTQVEENKEPIKDRVIEIFAFGRKENKRDPEKGGQTHKNKKKLKFRECGPFHRVMGGKSVRKKRKGGETGRMLFQIGETEEINYKKGGSDFEMGSEEEEEGCVNAKKKEMQIGCVENGKKEKRKKSKTR